MNHDLLRVLDYIEDNLLFELNLEDICREVNYSKFYISREFNSKMGMSITTYINKRRISEAAIELRHTNFTVNDIAFKYGFNSHKYFIVKFREEFGITPNKYRGSNFYINIIEKHKKKEFKMTKIKNIDELVNNILSNCKSQDDLRQYISNYKNCIIRNVDNAVAKILVVKYTDDLQEVYDLKIDMINCTSDYRFVTSNVLMKHVEIKELYIENDEVYVKFFNPKNNKSQIAKVLEIKRNNNIRFNFSVRRESHV